MIPKRLFLVVLALLVAVGCATFSNSPTVDTTPLQKAKLTSLYFLETYKAQLKDTQAMGAMAVAGRLAPGQLEVYRTKRALLIKAEPLIKGYDKMVEGGIIPPPGQEQEINNILNELLAASAKVGG